MTMYKVFEVDLDKDEIISDVISDDLVSRQTTSVRDGRSLGFDEDMKYVMVEGSEEAVEKAKELFSEHDVSESGQAKEIREAIKEEDESAAEGIGTVFG